MPMTQKYDQLTVVLGTKFPEIKEGEKEKDRNEHSRASEK